MSFSTLLNKQNLVKLSQSLNHENSLETAVKPYSLNRWYLEITCPVGDEFDGQYQVIGWANSLDIPVLYVNLKRSDGSIVTDFTEFEKELKIDKECMISQGELPTNGLPSFFIHPCRTAEFLNKMRIMLGTSNKSVASGENDSSSVEYLALYLWLQTFGRMVGLNVCRKAE